MKKSSFQHQTLFKHRDWHLNKSTFHIATPFNLETLPNQGGLLMKKSTFYLQMFHNKVRRWQCQKVYFALLHYCATLFWQHCNVKNALLQVSATLFRQLLKLKSALLHQSWGVGGRLMRKSTFHAVTLCWHNKILSLQGGKIMKKSTINNVRRWKLLLFDSLQHSCARMVLWPCLESIRRWKVPFFISVPHICDRIMLGPCFDTRFSYD